MFGKIGLAADHNRQIRLFTLDRPGTASPPTEEVKKLSVSRAKDDDEAPPTESETDKTAREEALKKVVEQLSKEDTR